MKEKVDSSPTSAPRSGEEFSSLPSVGQIIARKAVRPPKPPQRPAPPTPPASRFGRGIGYPFVPFPVDLANLERRQALPPAQFRVLALRRFAHPVNGHWITSTEEIARLIRTDRSTAQKAVRELEHAHFIHVRHLRSSTVQVLLNFGGFVQPKHLEEGLAPLRWDADFTDDGTLPVLQASQSDDFSHSSDAQENGPTEVRYGADPDTLGTVPRTKNEETAIRSGGFSTTRPGENTLLPVLTFVPQMNDEAIVQELARKLGEKFMNSFLSMRRQYGLNRLEKACALALDKLRDVKHPFRKRPGAYVRWLLTNGIC